MRPAGLAACASALVLVAACGRSEDATTAAPEPPATAPPVTVAAPPGVDTTDFSRPINLLGNEPFWAVKIRPDGVTFSAPDEADVTAPNPGPVINGTTAVWNADARGRPIEATLVAAVCQDGMSGLLYPFQATVEIDGRTLQGCAAYADAMPREGG